MTYTRVFILLFVTYTALSYSCECQELLKDLMNQQEKALDALIHDDLDGPMFGWKWSYECGRYAGYSDLYNFLSDKNSTK